MVHTQSASHTSTHINTHTLSLSLSFTHTYTRKHANTHTHPLPHTRAYKCTHTLVFSLSLSLSLSASHTRTHIYTHTHNAHTQPHTIPTQFNQLAYIFTYTLLVCHMTAPRTAGVIESISDIVCFRQLTAHHTSSHTPADPYMSCRPEEYIS